MEKINGIILLRDALLNGKSEEEVIAEQLNMTSEEEDEQYTVGIKAMVEAIIDKCAAAGSKEAILALKEQFYYEIPQEDQDVDPRMVDHIET